MFSRRVFLKGAALAATAGAISLQGKLALASEASSTAKGDMSAMEAILTRRSVRSYTDDPVSEEQIRALLRAAMAAPSGHNTQSWEFVVVTDQRKVDEVLEINRHLGMAKTAPLAILTCVNLQKENSRLTATQNVSAATQNILLAAHSMGFGAVWTGVPQDDMALIKRWQSVFKLPEYVLPLAFVVIGKPSKDLVKRDNYDSAKVHRNEW